jgi:phage shock protein A
MGVFTRFKDIVGANINAMLDKAEDPEKMIRLMIQEMEETLVELKSSCAGTIADKKRAERDISALRGQVEKWEERAKLAISKGREDLAREALTEKKRFIEQLEAQNAALGKFEDMIGQAQSDIGRLEEKIATARKKQRVLIQRHVRARRKMETEQQIRKSGSSDAVRRFEEFERRVDRMEAEADLVNPVSQTKSGTLDDEFSKLESEDSVEQELQQLKRAIAEDKGKATPKKEQ